MSDVTNPELARAYDLIEADDLEKARVILDSYLETHRNDADGWWLYAHAVADPMEAQNALRNVLRIDPDYPGAKDLLSESEQILTPTTTAAATGITRLASRPVVADDSNNPPDFLDRLDDDDDDLDDDLYDLDDDFDDEFGEDASEGQSSSRRLLFLFAAILLAVVLIAAALAISNQPQNNTTVVMEPTPTTTIEFVVVPPENVLPTLTPEIISTAAVEATDEVIEPVETEQVSTGDSGDFGDIYTTMSDLAVVPDSATIETTSAGSTFLISVCNDSGNLMTTALNAIQTLTSQTESLAGQAEAIGIRVVDCNRDNLLLRSLAISTADAEAFSQGTLTLNELRGKIRPITQ